MTLALRMRTLQLPLRDPFVIARSSHGEGRSVTTVVVTLRDEADGPDGPVGIGEGYPDPYYGDTPETMAAVAPLPARGARADRGRPPRRRSTTCVPRSRTPRG